MKYLGVIKTTIPSCFQHPSFHVYILQKSDLLKVTLENKRVSYPQISPEFT